MEVTIRMGELGTLLKTNEVFSIEDKFSKLKEIIAKEAGIEISSQVILDERGVDVTTTPNDKLIASDSKKTQYLFYVFNETLSESEIKKVISESKPNDGADLKNLSKIKLFSSIIEAINNGLIEHDIEERYNFKPIYAASYYTQGLDITSIQNFEQEFFNDYTMLKRAHKTFKYTANQGFKILKEIDQQTASYSLLQNSVNKTFDHLYLQKNQVRKKFNEIYEENKGILKMYHEGLQELKKYDLHPLLRKDGKRHLIDIYYDEQQMNKWRDSCIRTNDSAFQKYEKLDKDIQSLKQNYIDSRKIESTGLDDMKKRDLESKLQNMMSEVDPLLMSILSTAFDNLKELHMHLNSFCKSEPQPRDVKAAQQYLMNLEGLKRKVKEHQELIVQMEEHQKSLDLIIEQIQSLKLKNAVKIASLNTKEQAGRKELKKGGATFELVKYYNELNAKLQKDFNYLKHPSQLPHAYEKALMEVHRRRKFRKIVDEQFQKLQNFISKEKESRSQFLNNLGKILPSEFIPQLRETVPSIRIQGGEKDYELPEIDDTSAELEYDNQGQGLPQVNDSKKVQDLLKEISLLKEEHKENMKELNVKADQADIQVQYKKNQIKDLQAMLTQKDREIYKHKEELEKSVKALKDASLQHQITQRVIEESLAKKAKELDALAKSKNCKNCIVCMEDLRGKPEAQIIKDLNDKLFDKSKQVQTLEENLRKASQLINQVCQHNFNFLRQKTQDFYKTQDKTKAYYENKLMEVEDQLSLEQKSCTIVKQKLVVLEDKFSKCFQKENDLKKKLKEAQTQIQGQEREIKGHIGKIKEYQMQIVALQSENKQLLQDRQNGNEDVKKSQQKLEQLMEDNSKLLAKNQKLEDQLKTETTSTAERIEKLKDTLQKEITEKTKQIQMLTQEKNQVVSELQKIEESVKAESQKLRVQLKELTERYEKEMREKNEQIFSLNNLMNEQLDTTKKEQSAHKSFLDQLDKKEKELAQKNKDLNETTMILSKRDREIQNMKQESAFMQEQIKLLKKDLEECKDQLKTKKQTDFKDVENNENEGMKKSKGDTEMVLQRIKEMACTTLNIQNYDTWENSLSRALHSNAYEHINFMTAFEGVRVLFMPHSPGIYIALVLKNVEDIEQDQALKNKDMNLLETSSIRSESGPSVKRLIIKNNLFLDVESLSKNLQIILNNYQMIVIARVKSISKHQATEQYNPFSLDEKEPFFLCQIEKLEHIVGFESDEFSFTDYACK